MLVDVGRYDGRDEWLRMAMSGGSQSRRFY